MTVLNGKSVYGAIVSGCIFMLDRPALCAEKRKVEDTESEIQRFVSAKEKACAQLQRLYDLYIDRIGESNAQIFNIHMMMLEDEDFCSSVTGIISDEGVNAEYAAAQTAESFAKMLEAMDNEYMRARSADIRDVCRRIITILSGARSDFDNIPENSVVCAEDITPSEAAALEQRRVAAFVTSSGSPISHTAILAHSMNLPAIIGIGDELMSRARDGECVIVDGFAGKVILDPDAEVKIRFSAERQPTVVIPHSAGTRTADGKRITLLSCGTEIPPQYADGIAALDCPELEDEQKQYEYYRNIIDTADDGKSLIRLAAVSAYDSRRYEKYEMQIRAALRAACSSENTSLLFPMITTVKEARKILAACDKAKKQLNSEGYSVSEDLRLGFMIETPAAAIISDSLAPISDTLMIDSDRLSRLMLSRSSGSVFSEEFAEGQRSAVVRLIKYCARNAVKSGAKIGICGCLAADPALTKELLSVGVDKLCVPPFLLEDIRSAVMQAVLHR